MRRDDIVKAVDTLRDALQAARIRELLRINRNGESEGVNRTQKVLLAYSVFTRHYQAFGEQEKELMAYFGLSPLLDINFWSGLLESDQGVSRKVLADLDVGAYNVIYVMPRLRDLLIRETESDELTIADSAGAETQMRRLRIMLAERPRALTDPQVLVGVIRSVEEVYEALSTLRRSENTPLVIGAMDAGDSKSIDFFGSSTIVEELQRLILDVWDRLKYSTQENYRYQIEVALMAAGFVGAVNESRTAEGISEEEGQRITRRVAKAIEALFKAGAYTPEMDEPREVRASDVLAPKREMLEYKAEERPSDPADERRGEDLSPEKIEPMLRGHDALLRELGGDKVKPEESAASKSRAEEKPAPAAAITNGDASKGQPLK
ncbi:hypothetical protein [Dichotomicrobium thermohalophilum]|uniref:Uncharacterized protein n=1 Tax=Dichotomicrobium thermohalophilum TaxID=933063 RepID=A0A397PJN7_9HYPH|nr:hypothetical protein [Dichotomicrobium thermohalophilum]RIA47377.1 hypothetical protein BXY53_2455 [Dichotomicrobium thermohalophilum]